jgi:hypothetical protein
MRFRLFSAAVLLTTIGISYAADPDSVGRGGMGKGLGQPELGEPSGPSGVRTRRDPVLPVHPHTGEPVHTGRILVKVRNDSRVRASREFSNGLPAVADAESNDFGSVLALYSGRVRQLITSRSDAELAAITDRAEARSGRPQPDLTSFLVVETPGSLMMLAAQAINQLDSVEFVEIERQVVQAQDCASLTDCGPQGGNTPCNRPRSWGLNPWNTFAASPGFPNNPGPTDFWWPGVNPPFCEDPCSAGNRGCNPDPGDLNPAVSSYAGCEDTVCCALVSSQPGYEYCSDGDQSGGWDIYCAAMANFLCGDLALTNPTSSSTIYRTNPSSAIAFDLAYDPCFSDYQINLNVTPIAANPLFATISASQNLSGSCFTPRDSRGCDQPACCFGVCSIDPLCCDLAWDTACATLAMDIDACIPDAVQAQTEWSDKPQTPLIPPTSGNTIDYSVFASVPGSPAFTLSNWPAFQRSTGAPLEPKVELRWEGPFGSNPIDNCVPPSTIQQTPYRTMGMQAYTTLSAVIPGLQAYASGLAACQAGQPALGLPGSGYETFEQFSQFRGGGIDLYGLQEVMFDFARFYQNGLEEVPNPMDPNADPNDRRRYDLWFTYGGNVRIGVIDLTANLFHEDFQIKEPWPPGNPPPPGTLGQNPAVFASQNALFRVDGWEPSSSEYFPDVGFGQVKLEPGIDQVFLAGNPFWAEHGTAVLSMLLAAENGFGVTGIASNAKGYFFPAILTDPSNPTQITYRVADAITSATSDFEPGDVLCIPMTFADTQPFTTGQVLARLIRVAADSGIIPVVSAGNGGVAVDESGLDGIDVANRDTGALIVGAVTPGVSLLGGIQPQGFAANCQTNTSNFTEEKEPPEGGVVQLAAWGSSVVAAGYGDLSRGQNAATPTTSPQASQGLLNDEDDLLSYTKNFGGTSASAAMVAGVAANIQAFAKQVYLGTAIGPEQMLQLLTSPQATTLPTCNQTDSSVGNFPNNLRAIAYDVIQGSFFGTGQGSALDVSIINGIQIGPMPGVHQVRLADNVFLKVGTVSGNAGRRVRGLVYPMTGPTTDVLATLQAPLPPDEIDAEGDRLQLELTGRTTSGFALVGAFLFNYESGRWDWQGFAFYNGGNEAYQVPLNRPFPPSYNASQYLDPSNGEVLVRVYTCGFGSSASQVWHDLIQVSLGDPVKEP